MKSTFLLLTFFYLIIQTSLAQSGIPDAGFGRDGVVKTDIGKPHFNQSTFNGFKVLLGNNGTVIYNLIGAGGSDLIGSGETFITKRHSSGALDSSYGKNGVSATISMYGNDAVIQPDGKILIVGAISRQEFLRDFALARYNANGTLDSTFSGDGLQTNNFGVQSSQARSVILQNDGKIVVAGKTNNGFMLVRYNNDGSIDNSFLNEERHAGANDVFTPVSVLLQKDGKILVSGSNLNLNSFQNSIAVYRYNTGGSLDTTFGEEGNSVTSFGGSVNISAAAIQKDGKIVVAGNFSNRPTPDVNLAFARYSADGKPDSTFGVNGKLTASVAGLSITAMVLQKDEKILLAGSGFVISRFNSKGSIDSTFSGDGIQTTELSSSYTSASALAVEKNGKILLAGESSSQPGSIANYVLIRYNIDGSADTTFGTKGIVQGYLKQGYTVYKSTAVQNDGKVVAAGYTWNGEKFIFAVSRYRLNGAPDSSFSGDGTKTTSFGNDDDMANSVAIQADGKIVVAGSTGKAPHRDFAFARYNTNGEPDNTFSDDGKQVVKFGTAGDDYANAVAIQADGKIVAAGKSKNTAALVRLTANGETDVTFGGGDGKQTLGTTVAPDGSVAVSIALQKDGKIVIAGAFSPFALARYTANGYLDKNFGYGGVAKGNFKFDGAAAQAMAIQSDGKIIVAANVTTDDEANLVVVARYTNAGGIDSSFGKSGSVTSNDNNDFVNSLAIEEDGKILAGGTRRNHSAVSRITLQGTLDSTFGVNGTQVDQIAESGDVINSIAIHNNNLYAAGTALFPGNIGTVIKYLLNGKNELPLTKAVPSDNPPVAMIRKLTWHFDSQNFKQ